jgi:phytoene synthase
MTGVKESFPWTSATGARERALILATAPARARAALAALLALDDALGSVLRTTREPMLGQMRLTWWNDALSRLDTVRSPPQPVLAALAASVLPHGVTGAVLAGMIDGWEELLDRGVLADDALVRFATARGGTLFRSAAHVLGSEDRVDEAGRGWALSDLAVHSREPGRAPVLAAPLLESAARQRWSRAGRPLGAMAHLAAMPRASPAAQTARVLWHRVTGR